MIPPTKDQSATKDHSKASSKPAEKKVAKVKAEKKVPKVREQIQLKGRGVAEDAADIYQVHSECIRSLRIIRCLAFHQVRKLHAVRRGKGGVREYHVEWSEGSLTWEPESNISDWLIDVMELGLRQEVLSSSAYRPSLFTSCVGDSGEQETRSNFNWVRCRGSGLSHSASVETVVCKILNDTDGFQHSWTRARVVAHNEQVSQLCSSMQM